MHPILDRILSLIDQQAACDGASLAAITQFRKVFATLWEASSVHVQLQFLQRPGIAELLNVDGITADGLVLDFKTELSRMEHELILGGYTIRGNTDGWYCWHAPHGAGEDFQYCEDAVVDAHRDLIKRRSTQ